MSAAVSRSGHVKRSWLCAAVVTLLTAVMPYTAHAQTSGNAEWGHPADRTAVAAPQIIDGQPTTIGQFPFVVQVLDMTDYAATGEIGFCGGSLLRPSWVLTAAHCVDEVATGNVLVVAGDSAGIVGSGGQTRTAAALRVHPNWSNADPSGVGNGFDIALVRVNGAFSLGAGVQTVSLATAQETAAATVSTALGWGDTDPSPAGTTLPAVPLQVASLELRADAACASAVPIRYYPNRELCAGRSGGTATCGGDSGGPLTISVEGQQKLIGATSWGPTTCDSGPSYFAELNAFRRWLFNVLPKQICEGMEATVDASLGMRANHGDNVIAGSARDDVIRGFQGDDVICGFGGKDIIEAGWGEDQVFAGLGNDRVFGGPGADSIRGQRGDDVLFGGPGNDFLDGGLGVTDRCFGNDGDDDSAGCAIKGSTQTDVAVVDPG